MDLAERPLSIVHLLAPARFGGLETVVSTLASALAESGHHVTVALVLEPDDSHDHPVVEAISGTGVNVEVLALSGRDYLGERRRVGELLTKTGADVLHTHGYRSDLVDSPVARRMGVATATTVHGFSGGGWKNQLYEWLQTRSFRRFDAVIAVSDKLSGEIAARGVDPDRVHSIRNAWEARRAAMPRAEARRILGLPAGEASVAWIGRMSQEKAPVVMIQAAGMVRHQEVGFSLIGDGPERGACEVEAKMLGVEDRVEWHGVVADAGTLLKAFDAVVLTSWTEGTPMLLLEAMSAEVPIVTTAVGGIPDVVGPAEAVLCEAGDVEGIARAIDEVLDSPEAASRRAEAAKTRLNTQFAVRPWARRHVDLYRTLVES